MPWSFQENILPFAEISFSLSFSFSLKWILCKPSKKITAAAFPRSRHDLDKDLAWLAWSCSVMASLPCYPMHFGNAGNINWQVFRKIMGILQIIRRLSCSIYIGKVIMLLHASWQPYYDHTKIRRAGRKEEWSRTRASLKITSLNFKTRRNSFRLKPMYSCGREVSFFYLSEKVLKK